MGNKLPTEISRLWLIKNLGEEIVLKYEVEKGTYYGCYDTIARDYYGFGDMEELIAHELGID